jgi:hypothetical protein
MSEDHTGNWGSTQRIIMESAAIPADNTGRPYVAPYFALADGMRGAGVIQLQVWLERYGHVGNR